MQRFGGRPPAPARPLHGVFRHRQVHRSSLAGRRHVPTSCSATSCSSTCRCPTSRSCRRSSAAKRKRSPPQGITVDTEIGTVTQLGARAAGPDAQRDASRAAPRARRVTATRLQLGTLPARGEASAGQEEDRRDRVCRRPGRPGERRRRAGAEEVADRAPQAVRDARQLSARHRAQGTADDGHLRLRQEPRGQSDRPVLPAAAVSHRHDRGVLRASRQSGGRRSSAPAAPWRRWRRP